MHDRPAKRVLIYILEVLLILSPADVVFSKEQPRRGKSGVLCPHTRCHCFRGKTSGIVSRCGAPFGRIPRFETVNVTFDHLSLTQQNITEVSSFAFQNVRARVIDLSGNRFQRDDSIAKDAFTGLERVAEMLVFSDCELPEVPAGSVTKLMRLRSLRLDGNHITQLGARSLEANVVLRELFLYRNKISRIDVYSFVGLGRLEQLKLSENLIEALPLGVFAPLVDLTSLDLSSNLLSEIVPDTFVGLTKLRWLELNSNQLHTLSRKTFRGLRNMKYMKLEDNPLVTVHEGTFKAVAKLDYLSVDLDNVTELTQNTLTGLSRLKTLNLGELGHPTLPVGFFASVRRLRNLSLNDYSGLMVGGLNRELFASNFTFAGVKIWVEPVRSCSCSEPWIRDLVTLGVYVHGYCPKQVALSCVKNKQKLPGAAAKHTNEDRVRHLKPFRVSDISIKNKTRIN